MHFTFLQLVLVWLHTHFCPLTHFAMSYTEIAMRWRQWRCSGTNHTAQIPSVSPPVNRNGKHTKGNLGAQEKFRSPVSLWSMGNVFGKSYHPWVTIQVCCAEAATLLQPGRKLSPGLQKSLDLDFLKTCFMFVIGTGN